MHVQHSAATIYGLIDINVASPLPLISSISVIFTDHHYQLIVVGLVSAQGAPPVFGKKY